MNGEVSMYDVFDSPFLSSDTWHVDHPNDRQRFYEALKKVVRAPGFDPEEMGDYMRQKTGTPDTDDGRNPAIRKLVDEAHTIRDYLKVT